MTEDLELEPLVADGAAIASALGLHPVTIRKWAVAGLIERRGRDARRRTLYDYDQVHEVATRRGAPHTCDHACSATVKCSSTVVPGPGQSSRRSGSVMSSGAR